MIIISFVSDEIQNVGKISSREIYISQYKLYGLCFLGQDKNAVLKTIDNLLFLIPFSITFITNLNEVNRKRQVKIPLNAPKSAQLVNTSDTNYHGFDGMVVNTQGNVIGITNNGKTGGGNVLMELKGTADWSSVNIVNSKAIKESTTVAITPENKYFVINQDFSDDSATTWIIEQIKF